MPGGRSGSAQSRFVQRVRRRYAGELSLLAPGLPDAAALAATFQALRGRGHGTGESLRILRQLVLERLVHLDCDQQAALADITLVMTHLAEFALDVACTEARAELDAVHGIPIGTDGQPARLWVIGMGKLGARELNVSSDIDLIYVYDQDGETAGVEGRGRISLQEYFAKTVKRIWTLVGDPTEHGFVFRVDLALRPNGNSGPPAVSVDALEE